MHGFCSILPVYLALNSRSRDRNPGHVKCDRYIQQALNRVVREDHLLAVHYLHLYLAKNEHIPQNTDCTRHNFPVVIHINKQFCCDQLNYL
ncbi:hypothetical protein [Microcoleus sp. CAWBG640]|uniref:hypothetical protein n=1 Tax=Microcoleus sp. CAWBG640 TaxID=2841653 RepID=UPI00312BC89F